jgi:predicted ATPase
LAELRLRAIENRIAADLELGRHGEVAAELEALVSEHPLRERFWGQLMLTLYRTGRQGEELRTYDDVRRLLADRLGLDPGAQLQRLQAAILRQDPQLEPPAVAIVQRPGNLPSAITSFVGRRRDLPDIRMLLRRHRLLTLTGVGGVGKSRLAVTVATACLPDFPDGVRLVDLTALAQPGLVPSAIAATLGVREHPRRQLLDVLADHVRAAELLLVLDNCEHVVDEVATVADGLLRSSPNLRILATSRERLGLIGETVRQVSGLGVPPPGVTGVEGVGRADAVRLFVDRAAAVQPGFELTDATAGTVAELCRRLEGLPLALELAAAGVPVWGVRQIAAELDNPLHLLTHGGRGAPARHRTLRAMVDWSYGLLDDAQRRLFDRLAVFVGGFTLPAVEAVCGDADDGALPMAQVLAQLVDKSLVAVESAGAGPPRYRMLEALRAYASERLQESDGADGVRDRHAAHVMAVAKAARRGLRHAEEPGWLPRLETELGNIRAALQWSVERGDAATAVRLAGLLYPLWDRHGRYSEGRRW